MTRVVRIYRLIRTMLPTDDSMPRAASSPEEALLWGGRSLRASSPHVSWLWHGYLAHGALTLLTSQWKSGKTTLVSVLLSRLEHGGEFAGLPLAPGNAVVVSEEDPHLWQLRNDRLHFGEHVGWFSRPFRGRPQPAQWLAFLDRLAEVHAARRLSLVVIDPLAAFLTGRTENDASSVLEAILPLQRLASLNVAVLVLHHPRKEETEPGMAARGSGAIPSHADILIEMRFCPGAPPDDRRRRLHAFSRYPETPRQRVIELTADGTDYLSLGTFYEEEFARLWQHLLPIFESAPHKLTRRELRRAWPRDLPRDTSTVIRWLERAVEVGLLSKDGQGRRARPFRYWLPSREDAWRRDPICFFQMPELFQESGIRNHEPGRPPRGAGFQPA
jgi:hypothetical protein